jgi:alpha-ribazole phosphatase
MDIYLLRHTRPDVPANTCYGQSDIDIVPGVFQEELQKIRQLLPVGDIEAIYTSPLQRCYKLARGLHRDHIPLNTDRRIKELNFGSWELKSWNHIDGEELEQWKNDFLYAPAPGGESHMDLYKRAAEFWEDLTGTPRHAVLVVTHGGVLKSILSKTLEMPLQKSYAISLHYGTLIYIRHENHRIRQVDFLY